ncbi:hypothetical protein [Nocardia sp. NPDC003963]
MSILPREYLETFVRDPHAADRNEVREMARELLKERDRVAEALEQRAVARARIAELEAAQRPPLGYVAIADHADDFIAPASVVYPSAAECRASWESIPMLAEAAGYRVAELREAQS